MFSRSTWLHLRIPFSYFLLPIFLFAVAISPNFDGPRLLYVFLILHMLLYPASNGYNSYFDKDEESIGGLKNPPPVSHDLYYVSLVFDFLAIVLGAFLLNMTFAIMLLIYGLVSKAYSHPAVRLKKMPIAGWLTAGIFQGFFTLIMSYVGINNYGLGTLTTKVLLAGVLASVMLLGSYPMTQVYQHREDGKRGDRTISLLLGVHGTFIFVAAVFTLSTAGFALYFYRYYDASLAVAFVAFLTPVLIFFGSWYLQIRRDETAADFRRTMRLNFISATCLNAFFLYLFFHSSHVLQYLNQ